MKTIVCCLLLYCCMHSSHAADASKAYSIRGVGALSCESYLQELEKKSPAVLTIRGWIDGYVTATNRHVPDTYDALSFESTDLVATLVAGHCKGHPGDSVVAVLNALLVKLHDDRLRAQSPRVSGKVGEHEFTLYAEVLQRMQRKLASLGLFYGDPEPEFGEKTREALAAFQKGNNLQPTGLPDQGTLWRLLRQSTGNPALR